ncbi:MAG: HEPN domain-containing protein [Treponema sp.]|jgi:HEPN domain-containing protein|nr:HEPN domain-containing protein [Treponema sp.]
MDKLSIVAEWRKYADEDLRTANHMAHNMWPTPDHIICFHCQQAVEKYLKGFLILHDVEPERTHDLNMLCRLCKEYNAAFAEIKEYCFDLTRYGVQPRYPLEIYLDKADMSRALHYAEAVQAFMRRAAPDMFTETAATDEQKGALP